MGPGAEKRERFRQVAREIAAKISAKKEIVGVFLFGSAVSGGSDEESDVDVGLVYGGSRIREGREERRIEGIRVDVCHYPASRFSGVFESESMRGKRDTWFNASLWLGLMRGCEIIEDPLGLLRRWKEAALSWKWREGEIEHLELAYLKNLSAANLFIEEKRVLETLVFLREALGAAVCARLMRSNLVPYWDPRFLYRSIVSSCELAGLRGFYERLNDLDAVDASLLRSLLKKLRFYVEREGEKSSGVATHFHNALDGYWRRQYASALLSARLSAFLLAPRVVYGPSASLPPLADRILDGGQHVEMIKKLEGSDKGFHGFYLNLLFVERWKLEALRGALDALCAISNGKKGGLKTPSRQEET
ncbi:MAG: nucleotidyltransferase domain-containing protein [Candidatus Brockarchaeota archaeon]|nr:nucleotidyltransferase domain-containing protein [Candidatus Brockarchaeota archaeon]